MAYFVKGVNCKLSKMVYKTLKLPVLPRHIIIFKKNLSGSTKKVSWGKIECISSLCWLILCVNVAGPQCPHMWSNFILDVSVRVF